MVVAHSTRSATSRTSPASASSPAASSRARTATRTPTLSRARQITPEGTDTLTANPLFTALDVLPFVSKAAKLSTPYRTAAQAIEDQARILNNPVPRAPRPIPTALRQLGGGVEQVADLRQALIDAPGPVSLSADSGTSRSTTTSARTRSPARSSAPGRWAAPWNPAQRGSLVRHRGGCWRTRVAPSPAPPLSAPCTGRPSSRTLTARRVSTHSRRRSCSTRPAN
jgi:hypothetical protein